MKTIGFRLTGKRRVAIVLTTAVALGVGVAMPRIAFAAGTVKIDPTNVNVIEGTAGTNSVAVTFKLSEVNAETVTVPYSTGNAGDTAEAGTDYVTQTGNVVFTAGQTVQQVLFNAKGDQSFEGNEFFSVLIGTPVGGGVTKAGGGDGTVTIQNDDEAPTVTIDDLAASEGNTGETDFNFTLHLSAASSLPSKVHVATQLRRDPPVTIPATPAPPKAQTPEDYVALSTDVTIPAGATTATATVKVKGDGKDEFNEEFEVQLSPAVVGPGNVQPPTDFAVGIINDDDALVVINVSDPAAVSEGATCGGTGQPPCVTTITFEVTLSAPSAKSVRVDYATQDRSASSPSDYTAVSGSGTAGTPAGNPGALVFAPNDVSENVTVTIRGDAIAEPAERFAFNLSNPINATIGDGQAFGLILNDDGSTNLPTVSVSDAPDATESATGTSVFTITAVWPAGTPAPNQSNVTVCYTTADGPETGTAPKAIGVTNAQTGGDYVSASNCDGGGAPLVLAFDATDPPASRSTSANVTVNLRNDSIHEPDEFFQLQLVDAGNASITDPIGQAKVKDDDPLPKLSVEATKTIAEGTGANPTAHITVTLEPASGETVTVNYVTTNDGTAKAPGDFTDSDGTLTFLAGETTKTIDVVVQADALDEENETVTYAISGPSASATLDDTKKSGVLTITDDDAAPTVSISNTSVTEGSTGTSTATFAVTLSAVSGKAVTVNASTSNGTATAPGDYAAKTNELVTIPAGQAGANFTVSVVGDTLDEPNETFTVTLSSPTNATLGTATAQGTITDDDGTPNVSVNDVTGTEASGKATFTLSLDGSSASEIRVKVKTVSNTATAPADYTAVPDTTEVVFAPSETSKTFDVTVANDTLDEVDETFTLQIVSATNATVGDGTGTGTITDNDDPPTISVSNGAGEEGTSIVMTVSLSTASSKDVTVSTSTANGTATAGTDYTAIAPTVVTIPAGDTSKQVTVVTTEDTADEPDETFTLDLATPTNATIADGSGLGTIVDDDGPPTDAPVVSVNSASADEGDKATFTLTLSKVGAQDVVVNYSTANGTATSGDYTGATNASATIPAGQTTKAVEIQTTEDTLDEANETFTLTINSASNATVGSANVGTGTINDDEGAPVAPKITTGPGPGGGPHIKVFNANGTGPIVGFMDGGESTGKRVARGDVNGDGIDEIITGSGPNSAAVVSVYTATGTLIASSFAYANGSFYGGIFVAAGDVDGDGKAEVITAPGPGGGPHVRTWKVTGSTITGNDGFFAYGPNFSGGVTVAVGDVNGDGKGDIITGPGAGGGPHVRAFSAAGAEMFGLMAYTGPTGQPNWTGGINVAAGDLDGDGKAEIAVAPWPGGGPHLKLFNHDGTLLNGGIMAGNPQFTGGVSLAMGDLSGDNKAEILVGAMTQQTVMQVYNADLSKRGDALVAYPGFGGGVFVAIGKQ